MEPGRTERGVRLRICASADERPSSTNSALAFAAAEDGCLVLRRRDGSAITALPIDDFAVEEVGERMVSMTPKLPTGALAKDGSIMLALRDDVRWEEFRGVMASLRRSSPPRDCLRSRAQCHCDSPDACRDADVSRSPTCRRDPAGDALHLRCAHRDIHAGKLQSSWTSDKDEFLRRHDRHAASIPGCLHPISEETEEEMTGLCCGTVSASQKERAGSNHCRVKCRHHTVILVG